MELQQRYRWREQYLYANHLKQRTIGWISGYKLKTKKYFRSGEASVEHEDVVAGADDKDSLWVNILTTKVAKMVQKYIK